MTNERTLAFLWEIERADQEIAATLDELDELASEVDELRLRAAELEAFQARLPAERERAVASEAAAERQIASAREELADADRELAEAKRAGDERRTASARNRLVRARDELGMAERRAGEAESELARLQSEEAAGTRHVVEVEERTRHLAAALRERPRLAEQAGTPREGPAGVAAWARGARAALFVARGSLATERNALIRQANELGALVLGEPLLARSAAEVARRVRHAD